MNDLDKAGGLSTFNKKGIFLILSRKQNKKKTLHISKSFVFCYEKGTKTKEKPVRSQLKSLSIRKSIEVIYS